jgi:hypothetical protein
MAAHFYTTDALVELYDVPRDEIRRRINSGELAATATSDPDLWMVDLADL